MFDLSHQKLLKYISQKPLILYICTAMYYEYTYPCVKYCLKNLIHGNHICSFTLMALTWLSIHINY